MTPDQATTQQRIRELLTETPFMVLCTQAEGQPYGSVVAYAHSDDLRTIAFGTPRDTHKYELLIRCDRVALVIDDRPAHPGELMPVSAITATGQAREVRDPCERQALAEALEARHPALADFLGDDGTALFAVTVEEYLYVSAFQKTERWRVTG